MLRQAQHERVFLLGFSLAVRPEPVEGRAFMDHSQREFGLGQRSQQRLCVLQISRVKPLGKPAVDLREQPVCGGWFALLPSQASQAHHGSQLQQLRPLSAGNFNGVQKARLGFLLGMRGWGLGTRGRFLVSRFRVWNLKLGT